VLLESGRGCMAQEFIGVFVHKRMETTSIWPKLLTGSPFRGKPMSLLTFARRVKQTRYRIRVEANGRPEEVV
jgi:hypothetical protein